MLTSRADRFSQLLSGVLRDERRGQYLLTKSSLSEADQDELRSLAPEAHVAFGVEMREAVQRLRSLLSLGDPLYVAAMVQLSNLLVGWGTDYEPTREGSENKVELVAGFLASQPAAPKPDPPTDAEMQQIHDELDHILMATLLFNLSMPRGGDDDTAVLRFIGAMHWIGLRGTSYGHHGRDLALALYSPHDEWMLASYGFTISDVLEIGATVQALTNERSNELVDQARKFSDFIIRQVRLEGSAKHVGSQAEELLTTDEGQFRIRGRALIEVLQQGVRQAATFSLDELLSANRALPRERVEATLRELSTVVGSLEPSAYTGLFDKSPLVERPFLEFNGRYLLPIPGMVLRDAVALLEDRMMTRKGNFPTARAKCLDKLAVKYLSDMLPGSVTFTNLSYAGTELDGLVLFDDTAIVAEGKGTELSVQAHRGDVKRLKRDIGKAVDSAWRQGARARDYILADGDSVFRDENSREIKIPAGSVNEVIIVNPTLHELGGHASQLGRLRSLGLFASGEFPWSVFINDLRVIAETCDNAAVFLHYLVWRNRLPLGIQVTVIDELDLWSSYLLGERFGMLAEGSSMIVGNSTTDFDAYYDGLAANGPKQARPSKFLPELVRRFVQRIASTRPSGWRDAAGACLDLSLPELAFVSGRAKDAAREATGAAQPVSLVLDRVALVGIPAKIGLATVLAEFESVVGDATFVIFCRQATQNRVRIVWARYAKPVTFELSEFEKAAFQASHK